MITSNELTIIGVDRIGKGLMITFSDQTAAIFTAEELLSLGPKRYTCEEIEAFSQLNEED